MERKSISSSSTALSPYVQDFLGAGDGSRISSNTAYKLWSISDSVGNAVDMIAQEFAQLPPSLKEKKTGQYLNYESDHPVLAFLSKTRSGQSVYQFKYELMTSLCVAGVCYPVLMGNTKREPVGMYSIRGNQMSVVEGGDGWIGSLDSSADFDTSVYKRDIMQKGRPWTYVRNDGMAETIPIMKTAGRNGIYPESPLNRIYQQAMAKYDGHVSNRSLLKNGSRPNGTWSPEKGNMSQEGYEAFKNEVRSLQGPMNSGRDIVAPTAINYQSHTINNKDMDFVNLIDSCRIDIYQVFNIPLPLILSKTMTLGNYETAIGAFYDLAVLPRTNFIYDVFGEWLLSRYPDGDQYELTVNPDKISALKGRLIDRQARMAKIGAYSDNEVRAEGGDEGYGPEGNKIYKNATQVPIGEDEDLRL